MKQILCSIVFIFIVTQATSLPVFAQRKNVSKTIYIKPFAVHQNEERDPGQSNIKANKPKKSTSAGNILGKDIRDYMSEAIVGYQEYNLVSDEEIQSLGQNVERKMAVTGCESDECVRELMRAIDTDCIIHGTLRRMDDGKTFINAVFLDRAGRSVRKSVSITRDRYIESASRALAHYLLTRKDSYINEFREEMKDKEDDLADAQRDRENSISSIESAFRSQNACIQHSPFLRVGYGGFAKTNYFYEKNFNDYYPDAQIFTADVFIYRSRDTVGDGVDIYTRFFYKKLKADEKSYQKIADDMGSVTPADFSNIAGKYNPLPEKDLEMIHRGGDIGLRFVGTAYFMREAWSAYLMVAGRYVQVSESYLAGGVEYSRDFSAFGVAGGLGLEVTLNRYIGLFAELNLGYTPIGDNNVNIDGGNLLIGITLRSDHISGPVLGFW
jgi:hypothetical protein